MLIMYLACSTSRGHQQQLYTGLHTATLTEDNFGGHRLMNKLLKVLNVNKFLSARLQSMPWWVLVGCKIRCLIRIS